MVIFICGTYHAAVYFLLIWKPLPYYPKKLLRRILSIIFRLMSSHLHLIWQTKVLLNMSYSLFIYFFLFVGFTLSLSLSYTLTISLSQTHSLFLSLHLSFYLYLHLYISTNLNSLLFFTYSLPLSLILQEKGMRAGEDMFLLSGSNISTGYCRMLATAVGAQSR